MNRRRLGTGSAMLLICAMAVPPLGPALAQAPQAAPSSAPVKPARPKPPKAKTAKAAPAPTGAPPCARGQWKDDPVCFGADDPSALPTPSARSGKAARAGDILLEPKGGANLDPKAAQDPVSFTGNLPTPKPSNNDFGAGLGIKLPF